MTHWLLFLLTMFAPVDLQSERASVNTMLNEWHRAAWLADEEAYFAHFASDDAVFMGTDATERWTAAEFREWAHPYFEKGKAWEFFAEDGFERPITFNEAGDTAWFDEELVTPNMGPCRGSGVLVKIDDQWKIAHYNLSIPLPNAIVDDVVAKAAQELMGQDAMYTPREGDWRAWLETPGGQLPFRLVFQTEAGRLVPYIVNADEGYTPVPRYELNRESHEIVLAFDHYDSIIRAEIDMLGLRMHGTWTKRRGPDEFATIPFHASAGEQELFPAVSRGADGSDSPLNIRVPVKFGQSEETAVFVAREPYPTIIEATFETPTGDYRYLSGNKRGDRLRLSAFDGAHAFLFDITRHDDGSLTGDFWSGDWWHDTFKSVPDNSEMPEPWAMTTAKDATPDWSAYSFFGADGQDHKLSEWANQPRIIYLFGTWCPNCTDATRHLKEIRERFPDVMILGLAFELTGDAERDMRQIQAYNDHHRTDWPLMLAGKAKEDEAARALPFLTGVKAFPTFLFVKPGGLIDSVYTGFSGPATREAHEQLKREFEQAIGRITGD